MLDEFQYFLGDALCGVRHGQAGDVFGQAVQLGVVGHGLEGQADQLCGGVGVLHVEGGVLLHQGKGVLRLMVFGHVGRGHQDDGLAQQAELGYGACPDP